MFIERKALRLVFFELTGIARFLGTEIPEVPSGIFRWFYRLAQGPNGLLGLFQSLPSLLQSIFQKPRYIFFVVPVECAGGVLVHCSFETLEKILVIDDVSVIL